jgi:hypothetical protein
VKKKKIHDFFRENNSITQCCSMILPNAADKCFEQWVLCHFFCNISLKKWVVVSDMGSVDNTVPNFTDMILYSSLIVLLQAPAFKMR